MIDLRVPVHLTSRESLRIFDMADIWAARTGERVRLVSANDHVHSRGSAHYEGLALDFQSSDPDALSATFRQAGYRVLLARAWPFRSRARGAGPNEASRRATRRRVEGWALDYSSSSPCCV